MDPSARRQAVLDFYRTYHGAHGIAPTVREAALALGVSPPTVNVYVRILAATGLLRKAPGKRGYVPVRQEATQAEKAEAAR